MIILVAGALVLVLVVALAVVTDARDRRAQQATRALSHRHIRSAVQQSRKENQQRREMLDRKRPAPRRGPA